MKNVLISGASVAGPALALWLHRAGYSVTIVEKAPDLRDGGYAVDFRGDVHLGLLRKMGVLDDIEAAETNMGATSYVKANGKRIATMPEDMFAGDVEILRGDLARILYERTRPYTEYLFGETITAMREDADGVTVSFEHAEPRRFDLVVGADGLHSGVRRLAFGPEERFVRHLGLHCAVFTVPNHLNLDREGLGYVTPGRVALMYAARDNTEARAMFYFASGSLGLERLSPDAQRRLVAETFAGAGWETDRLLAAMDDAPDFYCDAVAQVRMESFTLGRVALIGDAAFSPSPLSGMGTGLALVSAYVLAGELAAAHGDHEAAFARYQEKIAEYARGCIKQGDGVAKFMVPASKAMAALLRISSRMMPYMPGKKAMARGVRRTAEAISLPAYPLGEGDRAAQP
ncbi:FAD-dependent monooxygenase [Actinomadura atramentaria]|uniref:FAD-dependent monooxygenase n=1 Tax=Actinomadura atramentaria TaxID=1990 RepID=UPI0003701135|nr:FAD-dependent monooxygenase [Actinomadura atramentaria]